MTYQTPQANPLTGGRLWAAALLLGLANFMVVLDTTIANVSVPHIAGALAVSPAQGTWVITSYSVAEAITVPLTGWLAQRFGAVRVFAFGMAGFALFSLLCGLAPSFALLVAFRVAQGLCGGPIMPMSQTLMLHIFPRERAGAAMGLWSMTTVVAPIAGPILGGQILDNLHWSWIFLINIPVAAFVGIFAYRLLISHDTDTRKVPVDYVGLGLLVTWVGAMQIMLDKGKELDWFSSPTIILLALVAAIGLVSFLIWEMTAQNPIVNLKVFRHRGFSAAVTTMSLSFGAFFACVVLVPLWLQTTMGYTATWAGYAGCLNGVLAVAMSPVVARFVGKVDGRLLTSIGVFWMGLMAFWRTGVTTDATFFNIALPQFIMGFGMPFFFISTTNLAMSSVDPEETASASGLANFLRTMGAAFATSIMTTTWDSTASRKHELLAGALPNPQATIDALMARGLSHEQALSQLDRMVQVQAIMISTNQMFMAAGVVFLIAVAVVWLAPKPKPMTGGPMGGH